MGAFCASCLAGAAADEPTNDADVDLLRALEDALLAWPGTVMCISHDRYFLDRICSHILAFEGDSQVLCTRKCGATFPPTQHGHLFHPVLIFHP